MKKLLLTCAAAIFALSAFAQSDDAEFAGGAGFAKAKKHAFFIGPKVGATFTTMTDPDQGELYDAFGIGYSGGIALQGRFGRSTDQSPKGTGLLGLGLELKYKLNSAKTIGTNEKGKENANLDMTYFEVPLYVRLYPAFKTKSVNGLYIEAGAAMAGTLSAKPKSLSTGTVTYQTGDLKGYDIRPLVGLGITTRPGLDINARYYIGTSSLAGNMASKLNCFEVSLAWMFKL